MRCSWHRHDTLFANRHKPTQCPSICHILLATACILLYFSYTFPLTRFAFSLVPINPLPPNTRHIWQSFGLVKPDLYCIYVQQIYASAGHHHLTNTTTQTPLSLLDCWPCVQMLQVYLCGVLSFGKLHLWPKIQI